MAIVIDSKVRLVITDADTTNFDYAVNKATELSILKDVTIEQSMLSMAMPSSTISATPRRVSRVYNTGYSGTKLTFKSYLKPILSGANVSSAEKLLWESLSATDTADTILNSTVSFTTGNTNKLRELFFYFIFENGSYYKISRGVVSAVSLDLAIDKIATATWQIDALDMEYVSSPNLTGTPQLNIDKTFIRNKLSTIDLNINAVTYNLAILKANLEIRNTTMLIGRDRVGEPTFFTGHYVTERESSSAISFYLNDKTDGSSALINSLLGSTTLDQLNSLANVSLFIGGSNNALNIEVQMPTAKIQSVDPNIGLLNSVGIVIYPQESVPGNGDEIKLIYNQ